MRTFLTFAAHAALVASSGSNAQEADFGSECSGGGLSHTVFIPGIKLFRLLLHDRLPSPQSFAHQA